MDADDPRALEVWIEARLLEYQSRSGSEHAETPEHFVERTPGEDSARAILLERLRLLQRFEGGFAELRDEPIGPGSALLDFEVLELLGAGGMGRVFRARQTSLARIVALKVPHRGAALEPRARARFLREAQAVAQLRHPGIVPIHQVGEHGGAPFLVMEYSRGRALAAILADLAHGRAPRAGATLGRPEESYERAAAQVLVSILAALQAAHEAGVVHRDVKPANVLLEPDGRVRVLDFGLARLSGEESLTESQELIGTAGYMAPEVVRSSAAASPLSDVYSAGVVLYQLLALRRPFEGATVLEILRRIESVELTPLARTDAIASPLSAIVEKAMAREVGRRYASAHEFAEDLRAYLDGREVRARHSTLLTRLGRRVQHHPAATAAGVVFALVLALLAGVWRSGSVVHAQVRHADAVALTREALLWPFADGEPDGKAPPQLHGHERAIADLESALALEPGLPEARVELAQYAAMQRKTERALQLIDGLEADGIRLRSLAWTRAFLTDPDRTIRPDPGEEPGVDSTPNLDRLAWARYFLSTYQLEPAMEVLRPLERDSILGPVAQNMQFEACCTRGARDRVRGIGYLRAALAIAPEHPILLANLAAMLKEELNVLRTKSTPTKDDARRERTLRADIGSLLPRLAAAEAKAPLLSVLWLNHSVLCAVTDRYDEAIEIAKRGLEHLPDNARLTNQLSQAYFSRWLPILERDDPVPPAEMEELAERLERALEADPSLPDNLYNLTYVHYRKRDAAATLSWGELARDEFIDKLEDGTLKQHYQTNWDLMMSEARAWEAEGVSR
jgi:serine/threonine protein kinase